MTLAIKNIYREQSIWQWTKMLIKNYFVAYLLSLLYYTVLMVGFYFLGTTNTTYYRLLNFIANTYFTLCGIIWFVIKNKSNISYNINTGKRSDEYKARMIVVMVITTIGVIIHYMVFMFSYEIQFFFPESIVYKLFPTLQFSTELLDDIMYKWLTMTRFIDINIIINGFLIFISYNVMKYFLDKSIME